jgi:hypothetical protein
MPCSVLQQLVMAMVLLFTVLCSVLQQLPVAP